MKNMSNLVDNQDQGTINEIATEIVLVNPGSQNEEGVEEFRTTPKNSVEDKKRHNKNRRPRSSTVWSNFSIVDEEKLIAACDLCGMHLSFKTTVSNLKSHLFKKHSRDSGVRLSRPSLPSQRNKFYRNRTCNNAQGGLKVKKKPRTELSGLEGFIMNFVGEEGDPITQTDDENQTNEVIQESIMFTNDGGAHSNWKGQAKNKNCTESDAEKKRRVLDLQLECLEIKKYTMQMEALLLEQQLQLPRSVYTQPLREVDVYSRSTQTDVGGEDTRVFYVSDKDGASQGPHIFSFKASMC